MSTETSNKTPPRSAVRWQKPVDDGGRNNKKKSNNTATSATFATAAAETPTSIATVFLDRITASLTPPTLKQYVTEATVTSLRWATKIHRIEQVLVRFDNPLYVPRSARISFKLDGTDQVKRDVAHVKLAADTAAIVAIFETDITKKIREALQLERAAVKSSALTHIIKTICNWARLHVMLVDNIGEPTTADFYPYVHAAINLPAWKSILIDGTAADHAPIIAMQTSFTGEYGVNFLPVDSHHAFAEKTFAIIVGTADEYSKATRALRVLSNAKAFIRGAAAETATSDATMDLDEEPSASPATLKALIDTSVSKAMNKLAKNGRRGAGSASTKKKPPSPPTEKTKHSVATATTNRKKPPVPATAKSSRKSSNNGVAANDSDSSGEIKRRRNDNSRRPLRKKSTSNSSSKTGKTGR